jgi:hypothetical protein
MPCSYRRILQDHAAELAWNGTGAQLGVQLLDKEQHVLARDATEM